MFKDDRLISILSGIVLMAAIGMIVQRGDLLIEYFRGDEQAPVALNDEFTFVDNDVALLDVLANDRGLDDLAGSQLVIVEEPACGRADVHDGKIRYHAMGGCKGAQTIRYRLGTNLGASSAVATLRPASAPHRDEPAIAETAPPPSDNRPEIAAAPQSVTVVPTPAAPAAPGASARGANRDSAASSSAALSLDGPDLSEPVRPRIGQSGPLAPLPRPTVGAPAGLDLALATPSQPDAPVRSGPSSLDAASLAPAATEAPETVAAPSGPAAPGSARAPSTIDRSRVGADGDDADKRRRANAPSGLFASRSRVGTQATPDPSRPRARVGLENILAVAPSALLAPGGITGQNAQPTAAPHIALADETPPTPGRAPARLAGLGTPDRSLDANAPRALSAAPLAPRGSGAAPAELRPTATLSLARIDRYATPSAPLVGGAPSGLDASIPRANPVRIAGGQQNRLALAAPDSGLGDVRNLPRGTSLTPVDTSVPRGLSAPLVTDQFSQQVAVAPGGLDAIASVDSDQAGDEAEAEELLDTRTTAETGQQATETGEDRLAARPDATRNCVTPPAITIDPRTAGETTLVVVSPCHAGSIAELSYSGLRLAVPIDASGLGRIETLGFEERSPASLWFTDGVEIDFELAFLGLRRLHRVALVWDLPVLLELHAFEYGADFGSDGHVFGENRRSFGDVRRSGGGYLTTYSSIGGIGQNMQVYSHWQRRGGAGGVINLKIDYTSRQRDRLPGTCGAGAYASPAFMVLRSEEGVMDRPLNRRLSALDCEQVPVDDAYLIEAAVRDVIVPGR